jgi:uncharacterized membrane protein YphA (DoxX/SURF4 family)
MWLPAATTLGFASNVAVVDRASAHVKWFCAFDVAGQPRGLENVLCADFELLVGIALLTLVAGCLVEWSPLGDGLLRAFNRATKLIQVNTEILIRAGCAFFFISVWSTGGILLTPELKSDSTAVGFLQLVIAAGMISRKTIPFSAGGIAVLFGWAVYQYGAFHLADYPVFLGIAAYLALIGLQRDLFGVRPLDVVRWAAAITLMWASVEKWAYPQWTFPLLANHPGMTFGYDPEFFMRAAGVIEFTLAFALLWTPLVRRCAAVLLAVMFVSAILDFGKIDAIGHAPIIAVLLVILADDAPATNKLRYAALAPVGYGIALAVFLGAYYLAHALLFGSSPIA